MANERYLDCIDACQECAYVCSQCVVSCLQENEVADLTRCIKLNLECAAICRNASEVMSLDSNFSERFCDVCADACNACAEECEKYAEKIGQCRECADVCRECAEVCTSMVRASVQ